MIFIYTSKRSLKTGLLHPFGIHSISFYLKETNDINYSYSTHKWGICKDLKVIGMLMAIQWGTVGPSLNITLNVNSRKVFILSRDE